MELREMDLAEVRNLVKWIDEQQRKGRQEIGTIQQQLATRQRDMGDLLNRIKESEGQVANLQSQINRLSLLNDQMDQLKSEIVLLIEQSEDRRVKSEKEAEQLRQLEHNAHSRALAELQEAISPIRRLTDQMEQRRVEDERLSASIATLKNDMVQVATRLDERVRDVAFLEEAQRGDVQRIAELQQSVIEMQKRADTLQGKSLVFEDIQRRNEARLEQILKGEQARDQKVEQYLEQGRLASERQRQELARWRTQLGEFEELMAGYAKQWRHFEEQHRLSRESTEGLNELRDRLGRRQNELTELQRVENERMKQQWVEFLGEDERRQKQRQLEVDQQLQERQRDREKHTEQILALQDELDQRSEDLKQLFQLQEKYADAYRQFTRIWLEGYESVVSPPLTRKIPG